MDRPTTPSIKINIPKSICIIDIKWYDIAIISGMFFSATIYFIIKGF